MSYNQCSSGLAWGRLSREFWLSVHIEIQLSAMKRFIVLTVSWWVLIFSYVSAPCMLVGEIDYYTMALFACQRLEGLPVELPTLSLVLCLVLCIVLLPNSMLQVSLSAGMP